MNDLNTTRNMFRCVITLMVFCLSSGGVLAGGKDIRYYPNVQNIRVYETPSPKSAAYEGPWIGHELRETDADRAPPPGWIHVVYQEAGSLSRYSGWVRKQDVVHYGSFQKVTRDWPIRYYCYWEIDSTPKPDDLYAKFSLPGTLVFEATFQRNGTARVDVFDNRVKLDSLFALEELEKDDKKEDKPERETLKGQVYRSGNVVMLKYGKDQAVGFTYGLDENTPTLVGGESENVKGQGTPISTAKSAHALLIDFIQKPAALDKSEAQYCKHAPTP